MVLVFEVDGTVIEMFKRKFELENKFVGILQTVKFMKNLLEGQLSFSFTLNNQ